MISPVHPTRRASDRGLYVLLILLVAWLPFPSASKPYWAVGLLQVSAFLLLAAWSGGAARGAFHGDVLQRHRNVLLVLGAWLGYHLLQVLPVPLGVVGLLSPAAAEVYEFALDDAERVFYPLSLDPGQTLAEFLRAAAYVALLVLILGLVRTRSRLETVAHLLVAVAVVESLLALSDVSMEGGGLGQGELSLRPRAAGTLWNPSHFAALLELTIPVAIALLVGHWSPGRHRYPSWTSRGAAVVDSLLSVQGVLAIAIVVMVAALLHTGSRGASFSLMVAGVITLGVMARADWKRHALRSAVLVLALLALALAWFGPGNLALRFEEGGDTRSWYSSEQRDAYRRSTFQMISDFPVFGAGTGSWRDLYPLYQDPDLNPFKSDYHAHNDVLQLVAEQGVIGAGLLGSAIALALWTALRGYRERRDPRMRALALGCFTGCLSVLLHAWWDFHFHITAIAAYFFVVLAMGMLAAHLREEGEAGHRDHRHRDRV